MYHHDNLHYTCHSMIYSIEFHLSDYMSISLSFEAPKLDSTLTFLMSPILNQLFTNTTYMYIFTKYNPIFHTI